GGDIATVDFAPLLKRLTRAIAFGKTAGQMHRDAAAKAAWSAVYGMLSEDGTGLADTLLARAEAQVTSLSMVFALLDESATIKPAHVNAALSVWQYAEDSGAYIFGKAVGDKTANTVLEALQKAGAKGLTHNYLVQDVFHRNTKASEITRALYLLEKHGHIVSR